MTQKQTWLYFLGLSTLLLLGMGLVAYYSPTPNVGFASSAAVLGVITGVAVGIERILEALWTFVGQTKGSCWPMNLVNEQVNKLVSGLDTTLAPFYEKADAAMEELIKKEKWTQTQINAAKKDLDDLKGRMDELKKLAPDSQKVNLLAASAFQGVNYLNTKYPGLQTATTVANQAITGVSDFMATFKDNPGRRLISIYVGSILGLIVAGAIGLDVFKAAMETQATAAAAGATAKSPCWQWGVALTGLLMGLGSNPTHEVIRAIQEVKKSRKGDNDPRPDISAPADTGIESRRGLESVRTEESPRNLLPTSGRVSTFSLHRAR
jgi:hypothetical protein